MTMERVLLLRSWSLMSKLISCPKRPILFRYCKLPTKESSLLLLWKASKYNPFLKKVTVHREIK